MVVFSPCKINLGLRILEKREDGYHNISTIFFPIPFYDIIEAVVDDNCTQDFEFKQTGNELNIKPEENICSKAYQLLKNKGYKLPKIKMHLHKIIPSGAGLGGGSANGAYALKLINEISETKIENSVLQNLSLELGSDCPLFFVDGASIGNGRGEILTPIELNLKGYCLVLVNPKIHISTAWAFNQITPKKIDISYNEIQNIGVNKWQNILINDFELPVFKHYPEIENIKTKLLLQGAEFSALTGTGSTVFGLFKNKVSENELNLNPNYFIKTIDL